MPKNLPGPDTEGNVRLKCWERMHGGPLLLNIQDSDPPATTSPVIRPLHTPRDDLFSIVSSELASTVLIV
jgi:hypothetical protein